MLHVAEANIEAAYKLLEGIEEKAYSLEKFPNRHPIVFEQMGKPVRRFPYLNYLLYYHLDAEGVTILRIIHSAMDQISLFPDLN